MMLNKIVVSSPNNSKITTGLTSDVTNIYIETMINTGNGATCYVYNSSNIDELGHQPYFTSDSGGFSSGNTLFATAACAVMTPQGGCRLLLQG
jgi:hypothetical protein